MRLDRLLSAYGGMSRTEAKARIKSGAVLVNGAPQKNPEHKIADTDIVDVSGKRLDTEPFVYYMMNKPAGVLCATSDSGCKTVLDLLPPEFQRKGLFPAGRLDKDTEGFVLITDDGAFAHKILAPKSHVPKTYFAAVNGMIPPELPDAFSRGLDLGGGDVCSPAKITVLENASVSKTELVIYEGMYHQVKRMFMRFSLEVIFLKRIMIGGLPLDPDLAPGEVRKILHKELGLILTGFGNLI